MSTKACSAIAALLLFSAASAGARITCRSLRCTSDATVAAARAIVERDCPCTAQTSVKQYRRCAKHAIRTARQELGAALTAGCIKDVKAAISESTCSRAGTVACNKRNEKDTKTTCAVVNATKCTGSACVGVTSCLDACNPSAQACAALTTTTTIIGGGGSTSTTLGGGGTTTTSTVLGGGNGTTSTTVASYSCSITTAACVETSCMCGPLGGIDYHPGASGTVSGPVGTVLDVNSFPSQGGTLDCGGWTRVYGNPYGNTTVNCDTLSCCARENGGQPETTTWTVYEMADLPCYCPSAPATVLHNYVVQCQLPPGPVQEDYETSTCS